MSKNNNLDQKIDQDKSVSLDPIFKKKCKYAGTTAVIVGAIIVLLVQFANVFSSGLSVVNAILQPLVIGGILAYILAPLASFYEKKLLRSSGGNKLRRGIALLLTYLTVLAVVVAVIAVFVVAITRSLSSINTDMFSTLITSIGANVNNLTEDIANMFAANNIDISSLGSRVLGGVNVVTGFASNLLYSIIFSIYFLADTHNITKYWKRVFKTLVSEDKREFLLQIAEDAQTVFSGYLKGQVLDACLVGVMVSLAMIIAGIPYGAVIGIMSGLGNLIPYIGPVVGFLTLGLVCLVSGGIEHFIIGGIILVVIMAVDGNIINPRLLSSNISVHPLLVVAALIGGAAIGGVAGMLVAVPIAALLKLQFDRVIEKKEKRKEETTEQ